MLTDFQVAPRCLPALHLGDNSVALQHQSLPGTDIRLRITHTWTERHGLRLSRAPLPLAPTGDAICGAGPVVFRWRGAPDDSSYHFQLSRQPRCAFPISPNFDVDLRSRATKLVVDDSWLAPRERYYWRVRAMNAHAIWGPWSGIRSFVYGEDPAPASD